MTKKMLIIAGMAAVLGSVQNVSADHSLLPPRAQQLFPHMGERSTRDSDLNLVKQGPMGPAAKSPITRETVAKTSASDPDLLRRPIYTGKWPFRNERAEQFEIAPVGKGKACDTGCTKDCCVKK